jgi:hypothetical protein
VSEVQVRSSFLPILFFYRTGRNWGTEGTVKLTETRGGGVRRNRPRTLRTWSSAGSWRWRQPCWRSPGRRGKEEPSPEPWRRGRRTADGEREDRRRRFLRELGGLDGWCWCWRRRFWLPLFIGIKQRRCRSRAFFNVTTRRLTPLPLALRLHQFMGWFSLQKILQNFSDFPSHWIFRHIHEALNIDKK